MTKTMVLLTLALLGTVCAQEGYNLSPPSSGYSYGAPSLRAAELIEEDPLVALAANIPGGGVPGQDYPILATLLDTDFDCQAQEYAGYFADTADESGCQIFHVCQFDGRQDSFLCPNGTVFNQQYFVCDWWFNVDCSASEQFRSLNAEIGKVMEDAAASSRSDLSQLYSTSEQRQALPPPSNSYGAPEQRQAVPPPSNSYGAPEQRQAVPSPSNSYGAPEVRQAAPAPSQFYNGPNGF